MTLNGVTAVILHYFTKFGSFGAHYVKTVKDEPILSAAKCCSKNLAICYLWRYS